MIDWVGPSAIIGLLTVGGLYLGHMFTRKNNKDTLLLSSRDTLIEGLRKDLRETRERLDKIAETVDSQGEQIRKLQTREWSLKRYAVVLIDQVRHLGGEPPEPPSGFDL